MHNKRNSRHSRKRGNADGQVRREEGQRREEEARSSAALSAGAPRMGWISMGKSDRSYDRKVFDHQWLATMVA